MKKNYTKKEISKLDILSYGYESTVYLDKDSALKILKDTQYIESYKPEKVEILKDMNIPYLTNPTDEIVVDELLCGYSMDYFRSKTLYKYKATHIKKIELLKQIRELMLDLHKKDIIICDLKANNILINNNSEIKICDIDGFKVKDYNPELINFYSKKYYQRNNVYDEGIDIYSFNFMTLLYLLNMSYTDAYYYIDEINNKADTFRKELFLSLIHDKKYESNYLLDEKDKIKRLIN